MSLLETIINLNDASDGVGLIGQVNVETGSLEFSAGISPGRCDSCNDYAGYSRECGRCGRRHGSNLSFPSGVGDGVYSAFGFYTDAGTRLLGAVWVFDEANAIANQTSTLTTPESLGTDVIREFLLPGVESFQTLPGMIVGEVDASDAWVSVQDPNWEAGTDVIVGLPFSGGKRYQVALFFAPAVDGQAAKMHVELGGDIHDITGGYPETLIPRAAVLVDSDSAAPIVDDNDSAQLTAHDWSRQFDAWRSMFQFSNAQGNGAKCAHGNSLLWNATLDRSLALSDGSFPEYYLFEALGWNIQASISGNRDAQQNFVSLFREFEEPIRGLSLEEVCEARGFLLDTELKQFLEGLLAS